MANRLPKTGKRTANHAIVIYQEINISNYIYLNIILSFPNFIFRGRKVEFDLGKSNRLVTFQFWKNANRKDLRLKV